MTSYASMISWLLYFVLLHVLDVWRCYQSSWVASFWRNVIISNVCIQLPIFTTALSCKKYQFLHCVTLSNRHCHDNLPIAIFKCLSNGAEINWQWQVNYSQRLFLRTVFVRRIDTNQAYVRISNLFIKHLSWSHYESTMTKYSLVKPYNSHVCNTLLMAKRSWRRDQILVSSGHGTGHYIGQKQGQWRLREGGGEGAEKDRRQWEELRECRGNKGGIKQ